LFLELHMIQNFSPSCLNRDDTNTPKDCVFGGFRRARISSQCLKRAIRKYFNTEIEQFKERLGIRTRFLPRQIIRKLVENGKAEETATEVVKDVLEGLNFNLDSKDKKQTEVLLFLNQDTPDKIAQLILDNWEPFQKKDNAKLIKEKLKPLSGEIKQELNPDIALFGRMVASSTDLNVDAACYVAHAFSTHKVDMEMDFFTAVDDLQEETESGAAHMGILMYNSSCFYRYSVLDLNQLLTNLQKKKDFMISLLKGYLEASINAIPTGKQTSMAAFNKPDFIMAALHCTQPWSLANAFATPATIGPKSEDILHLSMKRLERYLQDTLKLFGNSNDLSLHYCLSDDTKMEILEKIGKRCGSVAELINAIGDIANGRLSSST